MTDRARGTAVGALASVEGGVLGAYVLCLVLLFAFSISQLELVWARRMSPRGRVATPEIADRDLPLVTVQLPIYNERYVVERLLRSVAAIDYPPDHLNVQVLDDSGDDTVTIVDGLLEELRADGLRIDHVRRPTREGFKAGALAYGLRHSSGELIAIFDADFVPAPDILRVMVPHFLEPDVAAAQVRWGYLNERESRLTRVEAFMLDLHFGLEQPARHSAGLFLNFNGTAGIWRRTAIEDAGGWSARTLTEDIDLSYRAQLRGWRLLYLQDYACPSELPAQMSGLRSQQHRWMKGGAQNARLHVPGLLSGSQPGRVRRHACQHLLAGSAYLVILLAVLLSVPLAAVKGTSIGFDYSDYGLAFVASTVALVGVFHAARQPKGLSGNLAFTVDMVAFMIFTVGLSLHNGLAVLSGWVGRGGEFVRTPKAGPAGWRSSAYVRRGIDRRVIPEILLMAFLMTGLGIGWHRGQFALMPLQTLALTGLGWVVGLSLWHPVRARHLAPASAGQDNPQDQSTTKALKGHRL